MKQKLEQILKAALVAVLGGFLILGLSPSSAQGFGWHWPYTRPSHVSPNAVIPTAAVTDTLKPKLTEAEPVHTEISQPDIKSATHSANSIWVPVLMYHHVGDLTPDQRAHDPLASDLTVSPSDFDLQLKYFHDRGYHSISVAQLYDALTLGSKLPSKPIIFTFDDGYQDVFDNAISALQKYGYTGSFAIATDLLGRPSYAVWDDVIAADKLGMEIVSHTENHLDLTSAKYSEADLMREISGSKQILENKLGHPVDFLVYPYGHFNYHVGELSAVAGYKLAFTTNFGLWMDPLKPLAEPRVRVHGADGLAKLEKIFGPAAHTLSGQTNP